VNIFAPAIARPIAGAFFCLETELEEFMHRESEQYHFARIEGYRITLAHLED
jgi:hypothetical protein